MLSTPTQGQELEKLRVASHQDASDVTCFRLTEILTFRQPKFIKLEVSSLYMPNVGTGEGAKVVGHI